MTATWPGRTPQHLEQLQNAIARNCSCPDVLVPGQRCPSHQLLDSPAALDHLAFVRETHDRTDRWQRGEFELLTLDDQLSPAS